MFLKVVLILSSRIRGQRRKKRSQHMEKKDEVCIYKYKKIKFGHITWIDNRLQQFAFVSVTILSTDQRFGGLFLP